MTTSPPPAGPDLKGLPPIYILSTHLQSEELHQAANLVSKLGGTLTYDPKEARVFLGRIAQKKRAAFELRAKGVWTEEASLPEARLHEVDAAAQEEGPARKRAKVGRTERDVRAERRRRGSSSSMTAALHASCSPRPVHHSWPDPTHHLLVLKLGWLDACLKEQRLAPYQPYVVYSAKVIPKPAGETSLVAGQSSVTDVKTTLENIPQSPKSTPTTRSSVGEVTASILERAKAEASTLHPSQTTYPSRRRFGDRHTRTSPTPPTSRPPKLHRDTTSEFEALLEHPLPPLPDWASGPNASYACCRSTPMHTANAAFIAQLTKIKEARLLTLDEIGVRAYSTSIASIAAYPHPIRHVEEVTRLPGCEAKIAMLWNEWFHSAETDEERYIQTVRDLDSDADLKHLRLFWNIWGVGPDTARKFYFDHGWKDMDDVVEFGWASLTRVQQIGVKFYDEFLIKIPRLEVEAIRDVIVRHARSVLDVTEAQFGTKDDAECIIVGGYRRGKELCGDVDVILSHREESKTKDLVVEVVRSLEAEGWVTHTLALHTTTSDRGQATLPYRAEGRGHMFDSLDKALCVWQDPNFESDDGETASEGASESKANAQKKNPNIHRRVDIIISSWRTIGCAVLGWSGGTTFQRDIRRFVSKMRGWKFDSSGIRDRRNGLVLDLEAARPKGSTEPVRSESKSKGRRSKRRAVDAAPAPGTTPEVEMDDADTWQDRERRLMEGMGIGYRPAEERCTG